MTRYSYSRLTTYETCPLRYKFRYIDRIKKDVTGIEAFLGICTHQTLEKLYRDLMHEKQNSLGDLITYFNDTWSKNWIPNIFIVKKDYTQEDYHRTGERCLRDYYTHYAPFDQSVTLALEERIDLKLGNGRYPLIGYIDRLSRAPDGTYEIHDYKTSGRLPKQEIIDQDRQLALYQMAIQERWPNVKKVKLIWHFLLFDTELVSIRTETDLKKLDRNMVALIHEIEGAKTFEPVENPLCDWCEYAPECPVQKHRFKVDSLPVNRYLKEEGVELVNRYMQVLGEKREAVKKGDAELESLREAILAYADREGAQVLKGFDHKIRIRKEERFQLPEADDPRRKQLEMLIRKAGLWDQVATFSTIRLNEWLKRGNCEEKLAHQIKNLLTRQESARLYPSKIKETERLFDALIEE